MCLVCYFYRHPYKVAATPISGHSCLRTVSLSTELLSTSSLDPSAKTR